ncbi:hypothetical protein K2Y11_03420 [bacterium]|nr:hypothetical protein [bacterium]
MIEIKVEDPFGEHGAICTFQEAKYVSKDLIAELESKPDGFFKGGILYSPQKVEADSDDMIRDFCKSRDVDLYIHVPLGRAEDTYRHVVRSSKKDRSGTTP